MGLIFKDYSWHETFDYIYLKLNSKHILDVFHTDQYLKINFNNPKCILELFLFNKVDSNRTIQRFCNNNSVTFVLKKLEKGMWNQLSADIKCKEEKKEMRLACLTSNHTIVSDQSQMECSDVRKRQQRLLQLAMDEEERRLRMIREKKEKLSHNFFDENNEDDDNEQLSDHYSNKFSSVLAAKVAEEKKKLANLDEVKETNTARITFKFSR